MYDIRNLNIWKPEEKKNCNNEMFLKADINELNLGVRSFNCLKRAGCNTIQDVLNCMGEEGQGLRKIRNLGSRSEAEIMEKIEEYKQFYASSNRNTEKKTTIIKPAKKIWDRRIDEFQVSTVTLTVLNACGIYKVGDLYNNKFNCEPGWYAVRELFEVIPNCR